MGDEPFRCVRGVFTSMLEDTEANMGMSDPLSPDEERFLSTLSESWPTQRADIALDANASYVGSLIGMTPAEVETTVESLVQKGMVHAHDVQGVILVHPTKAGLSWHKPVLRSRLSQMVSRLLSGTHKKNP